MNGHLGVKGMSEWLKRFDMFGQTVTLLVKRKETYKSVCGSIISLWIICFTLMSFF